MAPTENGLTSASCGSPRIVSWTVPGLGGGTFRCGTDHATSQVPSSTLTLIAKLVLPQDNYRGTDHGMKVWMGMVPSAEKGLSHEGIASRLPAAAQLQCAAARRRNSLKPTEKPGLVFCRKLSAPNCSHHRRFMKSPSSSSSLLHSNRSRSYPPPKYYFHDPP